MLESFGWGFLAASSLIAGGAVALFWRIHERALGLVMAFGSGVLISAVAFELVEEAYNTTGEKGGVALGLCSPSARWSSSPASGDVPPNRVGRF